MTSPEQMRLSNRRNRSRPWPLSADIADTPPRVPVTGTRGVWPQIDQVLPRKAVSETLDTVSIQERIESLGAQPEVAVITDDSWSTDRISLSGHTDGNPYALGERGYSNWELSADRANACRRELIAGGIDEKKLIRVEGLGPAVMLDKTDPFNPVNRRISITVLNRKAEQRILNDTTTIASDGVAAAALGAAQAAPLPVPPSGQSAAK